jgi:hypothetical protein
LRNSVPSRFAPTFGLPRPFTTFAIVLFVWTYRKFLLEPSNLLFVCTESARGGSHRAASYHSACATLLHLSSNPVVPHYTRAYGQCLFVPSDLASHTLLDTRGVDHDFLITITTTSSEENQTKSRLPHRTVSDELSSLWGSVSRLLHHDDSLDRGTWIWGRRDVGARSMEDTQAPDFCSLGANSETNPLCWWFRPFAVS